MTLIICESLREIGEMVCVTSAWSSHGQTLNSSFENEPENIERICSQRVGWLLGCMFLQIRQLGVFLIFLVPLDTQAGTNCQIFSLETRASGRLQKKKSNFVGFSGTDSWKKTADFAGIFEASFAEKQLVKYGRFSWKLLE